MRKRGLNRELTSLARFDVAHFAVGRLDTAGFSRHLRLPPALAGGAEGSILMFSAGFSRLLAVLYHGVPKGRTRSPAKAGWHFSSASSVPPAEAGGRRRCRLKPAIMLEHRCSSEKSATSKRASEVAHDPRPRWRTLKLRFFFPPRGLPAWMRVWTTRIRWFPPTLRHGGACLRRALFRTKHRSTGASPAGASPAGAKKRVLRGFLVLQTRLHGGKPRCGR